MSEEEIIVVAFTALLTGAFLLPVGICMLIYNAYGFYLKLKSNRKKEVL